MAEYRDRTDGTITSDRELKRNTLASLPKVWNASTLDFLNVDLVFPSPAPEVSDASSKIVVRDGAKLDADSKWVFAWKEIERFTEYTDDNATVVTVAEQIASFLTISTAAAKESKLKDLKAVFVKKSERPRVDTGLGYFVDGNYTDLSNFQIGKDLSLGAVKDADNITRPVTLADYNTILTAIKVNGVTLLQIKWTHGEAISLLETVAEINEYDISIGWG